MKQVKRILAAAFMLLLLPGAGMTALATDPAQDAALEGSDNTEAELSEEEKLQQELDAVYAIPVQSNETEGWPQGPGTYGEAAIVMEVDTGAVLYAKNIDEHFFPASITKLLTTLVALENGQLTDPVTFSHDCVSFLKPDEASIGMKEGNQISLEQALYATLLASANEVAYAVGENVGKNAGYDYNWFVERMNMRCQELGGENSNFINTSGLHDSEHYTCARDMALIGRELFKHPEFFTMAQTYQYTIPASETTEEHIFQQHHKMLVQGDPNYYEFAIGGKTGYTSDALSTLVTMADNGSMKLVCVVLKTHGVNIYPDTKNLLDYAFANFSRVPVAEYEASEDIEEVLSVQGADMGNGDAETEAGTDPATAAEGITEDEAGAENEGGTEGVPEAETDPQTVPAEDGADNMSATEQAEAGADSMPAAGQAETGASDALSMDQAATDTGLESAYSGYVILPNGVEFNDLELEIIPDSDVSTEGTLEYRYAGTLMGSARAVLSQSYLEKRVAVDEESEEPKTKTKSREKQKDEGITGILSEKTLIEKCIIGGGGILLIILIVSFVKLLNKQK